MLYKHKEVVKTQEEELEQLNLKHHSLIMESTPLSEVEDVWEKISRVEEQISKRSCSFLKNLKQN